MCRGFWWRSDQYSILIIDHNNNLTPRLVWEKWLRWMRSRAPWPPWSGSTSAGMMITWGGTPSSTMGCPESSFPQGIIVIKLTEIRGRLNINFFYSKIWTPDIVLFNDATGTFSDSLVHDEKSWHFRYLRPYQNSSIRHVNLSLIIPLLYVKDNPLLVVTNEGHVRWIPPLVIKYSFEFILHFNFVLRSLCDFEPKSHFSSEYLQQIFSCDLKFGSWVYNAGQLDIINVILFELSLWLSYNLTISF